MPCPLISCVSLRLGHARQSAPHHITPPSALEPQLENQKERQKQLAELYDVTARYRGPLLEAAIDLEQALWHLVGTPRRLACLPAPTVPAPLASNQHETSVRPVVAARVPPCSLCKAIKACCCQGVTPPRPL